MKTFKLLIILFVTLPAFSQSISEVKLKNNGWAEKAFAKAPKKVYVHSFVVNYQILFEKQKSKAATSTFGGGYKGSQKAAVATTLEGVDAELLKKMTDKLFEEFKSELETKGLEVISAKGIKPIAAFEKYELVKGGRISNEGIPGCVSVNPSQIDFYEKERLLEIQLIDRGPMISRDLEDAIIAQVVLNVPYLDFGSSGLGLGESQVKVKTNLRIAQSLTGTMKKEAKAFSLGGNEQVTVNSKVIFGFGKRGLAYTSCYSGYLGKDVSITGVMENETIKAVSRTTNLGTSVVTAGNLVFYMYENDEDIEIRNIEVDANKYENGVYKGLSAVLMNHTNAFLENF